MPSGATTQPDTPAPNAAAHAIKTPRRVNGEGVSEGAVEDNEMSEDVGEGNGEDSSGGMQPSVETGHRFNGTLAGRLTPCGVFTT